VVHARLRDNTWGGRFPSHLTFGLICDVTDGVNIDLDASVVCFDSQSKRADVICAKQKHFQSKDGSIVHHGDEKEE
jgi:stress response protein SCP2